MSVFTGPVQECPGAYFLSPVQGPSNRQPSGKRRNIYIRRIGFVLVGRRFAPSVALELGVFFIHSHNVIIAKAFGRADHFLNILFAFFFGIAFGRNNKGVLKVSPNKSIAGFVGGLMIPGILGVLSAVLFPDVFIYNAAEGFIVGFITACLGTVGDLIESSFKRSAEVKDSGSIIPGRGGILDSVDSVIMAAPVYVAIITLVLSI